MSVGDRIMIDENIGTIKYVGNIPVWGPNILAYGVEWDDSTRGKNCGDLDGTYYFYTSVAGAGLFVKANNRKIAKAVSFTEAINWRYTSEENERVLKENITFGSKTVEKYGFHKLNVMVKDVTRLKTVMLDKQKIKFAGELSLFPNTESLDLSFNLLSSWTELDKILANFPNLKTLNLNGNRFSGIPQLHLPHSVKELYLASTMVSVEQVNNIDMGNISKIVLAGNNWTLEDVERLKLNSCSILDLSSNKLQSVPQLHGIQEMLLADNNIQIISGQELPDTINLDIRGNSITGWENIDALGDVFPNMASLKISGCPVFSGLSTEELTIELIARLESVSWLNGSQLVSEERRNAELYFISKVNLGSKKINNQRRWKQLMNHYRISVLNNPVAVESGKIRLLIRFEHSPNTEIFSRVFLKTNTVLRLKGVISKIIGKTPLDINLYYVFAGESRQYLDDDIARLRSFIFSENQKVYVSLSAA